MAWRGLDICDLGHVSRAVSGAGKNSLWFFHGTNAEDTETWLCLAGGDDRLGFLSGGRSSGGWPLPLRHGGPGAGIRRTTAVALGTSLVLWVILLGAICSTPWWALGRAKLAKATAGRPVAQTCFRVTEMLGFLIIFFLSLAWMADETYNPFIYYRF